MLSQNKFKSEYIIEVYDYKIGMEGILVIDNTVLGPGKGGIRMTHNVTVEEVIRLAKTMTLKNALANIPFGGAKAGIKWEGGSEQLKKDYIQSFARLIEPFIPKKYIAGPDINTGEKEMQWFAQAIGSWSSATGKPKNFCQEAKVKNRKCGIPHEAGSTGFGVAQSTKIASEILGIGIKNATVSIHGFGNVGSFAYKFLTEIGAKVVAIADKSAALFSPEGFDKDSIERLIKEKKELSQYRGKAGKIDRDDFWDIPVDILIPASITDSINETNKEKIKAKIIVEAANIPMREYIEEEFFEKGVLIVPDLIANAGGVISSYAEHKGYQLEKMFKMVEEKIKKTTQLVLKESIKRNKNPRQVAIEIAQNKIESKMKRKG
ncbi:MAG: Glu/Leu/Phe/Val dehydrogenase [Candidatus Pacebacteria bacterium]|nr:Glu/Leu/Phe/Val dehydrogenase [Candidatus Paceibacterota bacterium]